MITLDVQVPVHYNVIKEPRMKTINATAARANLFSLLHEAHETDEPIMITTRNGEDAILLSEQTWRNLIETAYFYLIHFLVLKMYLTIYTFILKMRY